MDILRTSQSAWAWLLVVSASFTGPVSVTAQDDFDRPPILYSQSRPDNAISRLQDRLTKGEVTLKFEEPWGYLRSVLTALEIPESSQSLVFSKTSLQRHKIAPRTPRALYFNADVYLGYVRHGSVLEVSVADAKLGTVFYSLEQEPQGTPRFERHNDNCLLCHAGGQARGVPGHLVRSIYVDKSGQPLLASGSFRVDHSSPFKDRWGGWYVSGTHGDQTHLGNLTYKGRPDMNNVPDLSGQNVTDLRDRFDTSGYLHSHSDLVALMVLAHQAGGHNLLTKVAFDVRTALHREASLNKELGEADDHRWDSTNTVMDSWVDTLLKYFLFIDEPALASPIAGTTAFAREFGAAAARDPQGRSLRDLDLEKRLFKVPCSYLIETESFATLPEEFRQRFYTRLGAILAGENPAPEFARLTPDDRRALRDVLVALKPGVPGTGLPANWGQPVASAATSLPSAANGE